MRVAADNLAHITLELGGNDAAIVLEDAKLDDGLLRIDTDRTDAQNGTLGRREAENREHTRSTHPLITTTQADLRIETSGE